MGAKATFNHITRIIKLTEAPTLVDGEYRASLDVKVDLYSDQKEDWLANPTTLRKVRPPITVIGGQVTSNGFAGSTFFLANDWNVELYDADQILNVSGNFYKLDGTSPFIKPSGGTYATQIDRFISNIVDTIETGGSSLTAAQVWDLSDGIEAGWTPRQAMRVIAGAAGGKSDKTGNDRTYRDLNDSKDRIVATVDATGNRTAITYDKS